MNFPLLQKTRCQLSKIFFSYSHQDELLRDQLDVHLAALKRQRLIQTWHDRRITAGTVLDNAIDSNLETADVILCLVSPDFIASDYCYSREMQIALERHNNGDARVIPVILRHCDWTQTPLGKLRATPRDGKPVSAWPDKDEAFLDVAKDIRNALSELGHNHDTESAPLKIAAPLKLEIKSVAPRTANLRVKHVFTDLERDQFLDEAFEFLAEFFANSLEELKTRHAAIGGRYQRVDKNRFIISLYRDGKKRSAMTVFRGGMLGHNRGLAFNNDDSGETSSTNGNFVIRDGSDSLEFDDAFFGLSGSGKKGARTPSDIAEDLWGRLIEPLQRER